MKVRELRKYFFRTVVNAIVKVKDAISRRVCYQHIRVVGDIGIITALAFCYTIAHEHRDTIEFQSVNLDARVA